MKKIIIGLMSILTLTAISCKDENKQKGLNPYDTAIIKAESKTKSVIFDDMVSYQDSLNAVFAEENFSVTFIRLGQTLRGGLGENEIDRVKQEFTLRNMWVVYQMSEDAPYTLGTLPDTEELIFLRRYSNGHSLLWDTIAYVPSKILFEAGKKVKAAFAKDDFDECRRLLQTEYKFKPIDAKGYEALKAAGLN